MHLTKWLASVLGECSVFNEQHTFQGHMGIFNAVSTSSNTVQGNTIQIIHYLCSIYDDDSGGDMMLSGGVIRKEYCPFHQSQGGHRRMFPPRPDHDAGGHRIHFHRHLRVRRACLRDS